MSDNKLVIVGGGFAGIRLAVSLERRLPPDWRIDLLSQDNYITYNPLLPEVVGASLLPGHTVAPLRQMVRRARVCMVRVTDIDVETKTVHYLGEGSGQLEYDQLVMACGNVTNLSIVPGMASYALPLKTLGDALFIRNRVISRLEQAELNDDPEARRWLLTFIVVGGGFSGVEVAGELVDFLRASVRYYPRLKADDCRVILLHGTDRLLPELSASLGEFARRKMCKDGLDVRLNARATLVDDRGVLLGPETRIAGGTVICTIGNAPNPLVADLPVPKKAGRIETAPDLSVPGYDGLWAIGDCAAIPNALDDRLCPPTAQFADRQARHLADNIVARLEGRQTAAFRYKPVGQLSSIGHNKAVAELGGMRIAGFVAWLLWRGIYLLKIPTLARKARIFLEWNWAMFFPPDIAHLGFARSSRRAPERPRRMPENTPAADATDATGRRDARAASIEA